VGKINLVLVIVIVFGTIGGWAAMNQPRFEPAWPASVSGFAFSPLRRGQVPSRGQYPTYDDLDADLELIASSARSVRTYSLDGTLSQIPNIAARHGLDVTAGIDLDEDSDRNASRLEQLRIVASGSYNVRRVIVGNEVAVTADLAIDELTGFLDHARATLSVPVGAAEPWHVWMQYPELADHVDFIVVHLLPYWESIPVDAAVDYIVRLMHSLESTFPDKPIVIGEVGWPSFGRARGGAVASPANAAVFLRRFLQRADQEGYEYFLMEAFDQPWKRFVEGEVGAYWGVYDIDRELKLQMSGSITPTPGWIPLSLASALVASLAFMLMVADGGRVTARGRLFAGLITGVVATGSIWVIDANAQTYWSLLDGVAAAIVLGGIIVIVLLILVEAHEWMEASWCARKTVAPPAVRKCPGRLPKVSIHVPIYSEPPALLYETLKSLAELDYPDFEVLVVDNNTKDEQLWRPVEMFCAHLGERFRFFHVDPLAGYKAGALNFTLRRTAQDASIIAVVDSDYKVDPQWLRDLVPHFAEPAVAIVQAPQDYRDGDSGVFKAMCQAEYEGFFKIGMITRNDRNAIIQHGTMTMIRERVLREVGGWAQWTITEDAELGLRVLEHGYEARYVARSYGRGLTPDNFHDYKMQRFRWALGAIQILRGHRQMLLAEKGSALSRGQRYHFVAGWVPWLADGLNLPFNAIAIVWSVMMLLSPDRFHPPLASFSTIVLALFAFKLTKILVLYKVRVGAGLWRSFGAAIAGLSLVYTVGTAVIAGLLGRKVPFCRTPKLALRHTVTGAIAAAAPETTLGLALLACSFGVWSTASFASIDRDIWALLLAVFAVPHLAALLASLSSVRSRARRFAHELEEASDTRLGADR
jgi:exo-beta-1,3-glucanase (GH17 family)/cellulose synthase/poly-beta-1,6-N-acetylglucosamine synthase-like glycosyltransferase